MHDYKLNTSLKISLLACEVNARIVNLSYSQYMSATTGPEIRDQSQRSLKPSDLMISQLFF